MWTDNETDKDFLNFTGIAGTVAKMIVKADGAPVSIGVSGSWGVGKSSMIQLIKASMAKQPDAEKYVFVVFNGWLYQGYDDARASLMEVIGNILVAEAEKRKTGLDKAKDFVDRIDWFRAAKLGLNGGISLALGLAPVGLIGEGLRLGNDYLTGNVDQSTVDGTKAVAGEIAEGSKGLLKPKVRRTAPSEIHALRKSFEDALEALGIRLVVLIDDLDRCLPETTISTLEAIRLFLFMKNTAFVIAADDKMIKHAVKSHFGDVGEDVTTNYFDKLIQQGVSVPPLGLQEVRAYISMLFVEDSTLAATAKDELRKKVAQQLMESWQGKRVDRAFFQKAHPGLPPELIARLGTADRLAPFMTSAVNVHGNPRLIKRFLNALSMRMSISQEQGVGVDEAVLAKMLLFERCGDPKAYAMLTSAVVNSDNGTAKFLDDLEGYARIGKHDALTAPWNGEFEKDWLILDPPLKGMDLRGILYVSREHAPIISAQDRLSSEAAELLPALLAKPKHAGSLKARLQGLSKPELSVFMEKLLGRAVQEQSWGTPDILDACLVIAEIDELQGASLAGFLMERPPGQIKASIVPKIGAVAWAAPVLAKWKSMQGISTQVKKAIEQQKG